MSVKSIQSTCDEYQFQLSQISHELRNPITLINSYLQLTESHYPQVLTFDTWPAIRENMASIRLLLDDLSAFHHADRLQKSEFSLTWFLESLVNSCKPAMHPTSMVFEKTGAVPTGSFDRLRLQSMFLNLIRNAKEALGNQPDGQIRILLSFDGENFQITVCNNGPQIPVQDLPTLFQPFITHKENGTGLGLAIVERIVQAHGGTISVCSDPTETRFHITLPLCYT